MLVCSSTVVPAPMIESRTTANGPTVRAFVDDAVLDDRGRMHRGGWSDRVARFRPWPGLVGQEVHDEEVVPVTDGPDEPVTAEGGDRSAHPAGLG